MAGLIMQLTSIGIKEAKVHLSRLLKLVKNGNEVIITDRGNPVGKIVPIQEESLPLNTRIQRLEKQGIITPSSEKNTKRVPPPIPVADDLAQRFLREDRDSE